MTQTILENIIQGIKAHYNEQIHIDVLATTIMTLPHLSQNKAKIWVLDNYTDVVQIKGYKPDLLKSDASKWIDNLILNKGNNFLLEAYQYFTDLSKISLFKANIPICNSSRVWLNKKFLDYFIDKRDKLCYNKYIK